MNWQRCRQRLRKKSIQNQVFVRVFCFKIGKRRPNKLLAIMKRMHCLTVQSTRDSFVIRILPNAPYHLLHSLPLGDA